MSEITQKNTYEIVWLLRRLFRALGQRANERLGSIGLTVADRAVMEFLYPDISLSVPQIARKYNVSRQHIQTTVNTLLNKGFLRTESNPRHKRSPLITLTAKGTKLFAKILIEDKQIIEDLFTDVSSEDIGITKETLQTLLNKLQGGKHHD